MPKGFACKLCVCFPVNGQHVLQSVQFLCFSDALLSLHVRWSGCWMCRLLEMLDVDTDDGKWAWCWSGLPGCSAPAPLVSKGSEVPGHFGKWASGPDSLYRHLQLQRVKIVPVALFCLAVAWNRLSVDVSWLFWQPVLEASVLFSYPRRKGQRCRELSGKGEPPLDVESGNIMLWETSVGEIWKGSRFSRHKIMWNTLMSQTQKHDLK